MGFILRNFAAPLAFIVTFKLFGPKPAIALAIAITIAQVLAHRIHGLRLSPFFYAATGLTVVFGGVDLVIDSPRYFRLEPFAHNFVVGAAFLASLLAGRPILGWFVESLPKRFQPSEEELQGDYLRKLTAVWAVYLLVKAFAFLWLAFRVDLAELILVRSTLGGGSLWLLVLGELAYRKRFRGHGQGPVHGR
jgi:intracellular septation protein